MILQFINISKYFIYQGISPSLLATISLGDGLIGNNHHDLIDKLYQKNIIQSVKVIQALKKLDRQLFTNQLKPYKNQPYNISGKQKMTDILTHSIILQNIQPYLQFNNAKILDIGTGHGYLSYAVMKIIQLKGFKQQTVIGIDINQKAIQQCKKIKQKLITIQQQILKSIYFQVYDIQQYIKSTNQNFDIIIGGFYIQEKLSNQLEKKLTQRGIGIWATDDGKSNQGLFLFSKNKNKQLILNTLFSARKVISQYNEYFIEDNNHQEQQSNQEKQIKISQQIKDNKNQIRQLLRIELENYKKQHGYTPSLQQMKNISNIANLLSRLNNK